MDCFRGTSIWNHHKHIQQYQGQENQEKNLPIIWTTNSTFPILVDHCNSDKKYMLPPLTCVEQAKYNPSDVPKKMTYPWITLQTVPLRVYYNICIIKYFLDIISPNNDMLQKMKTLFANYPEIDLNALGFPQEWESEPLWR